MVSIIVTSGKGGVGKTTFSINLAVLLAKAGKKTVLVDADIGMANVGIMLGQEKSPITLNNVLMGENNVQDAIFQGVGGVNFILTALSLDKIPSNFMENLPKIIAELNKSFDFVILDSAPGVGDIIEYAHKSCDEAILLSTPEPSSIADTLKSKIMLERLGMKIRGVVLNRVQGDSLEVSANEVEKLFELKVLASLPESLEVRKCTLNQTTLLQSYPGSSYLKRLKHLTEDLIGEKFTVSEMEASKESLIGRLFNAFRQLLSGKPKTTDMQAKT
ncbi:Iron-sulfur cluster carrier protein [uncultured archaeon]|nr:Iron-sulfur cluster carrier protein [uncultured archaeon]